MNRSQPGMQTYTRRCFNHDYRMPGIYHIILKKTASCSSFGSVAGDPHIPFGNEGCARIARTPLGNIIQKEVYDIPQYHPEIRILQYVVMPDHVHILIHLKEYSGKHIGYYIGNLKSAVIRRWKDKNPDACMIPVFEENYTDRPLFKGRSLDALYIYIRENPHRLAVRIMFPQFFTRINERVIAGEKCQAYGNIFLLDNPLKSAVIIHRSYSAEERRVLREEWLSVAPDDGVLVSPFISKDEKEIRTAAEQAGGKIILITDIPFGERYKPARHHFSQCEQGNLLIISLPPLPGSDQARSLSRERCLRMNKFAETLASS